jgi:hypothetical protein
MKAETSAEVRVLFDLLLAEDWLAKSAIIGRERALLPVIRAILRDEARNALERGDEEDASIFAAHVSLLDDIERRGLGSVQAEIIRVMAMLPERSHAADL